MQITTRSCAALQGGSRLSRTDAQYFLQSMGLRLLVLERQLVPGLNCRGSLSVNGVNVWGVEAEKQLPIWSVLARDLLQLSANECRRVVRSRVCNAT